MQLNALTLLVLDVLPVALLMLAWRAWKRHDNQLVNGQRRTLYLVGSAFTAISVLLYVGFAIGSSTHAVGLIRAGFWSAAGGLFLCFFGKGRSRGFSVGSAGLMWAVWFLFAWAPA